MLVALAGGVGAARFLRGLIRVHPPADILVIGNTGDDLRVHGALDRLGEPSWFSLGDRDIATHLLRTRLLTEGATLSEATAEVCRRLGVPVRLVPMSDQPVETRVEVDGSGGLEDLGFQEYWVARQARDPVRRVTFAGIERARPAPGVLDAIRAAEIGRA